MQRSSWILIATALLGIRPASAEEPPPSQAPPPDQASGVARPEATPPSHELFWIPRALLFVPRWAFWIAMQPVRLGAWAAGRYRVGSHVRSGMGDGKRPFSIYPTVTIDTLYGLTAGARAVHRDLAGRGERLKLRGDFSGQYRRTFGVKLHSGERFGQRFAAELEARHVRRPAERFFGIGNADRLAALPPMPIDPAVTDAAVEARFREQHSRAELAGQVRIAGPLSARVGTALTTRSFAGADGTDDPSLEAAYDTSQLAGWSRGTDDLYVEGELVYDSRRPASAYQTRALDATGWYAAAHVGRARGIGGDPSDYVRYGAEAMRLLDLYRGSRILALRLLAESIGGSDGRTDGKISFVELPMLGGSQYLRGYPAGRFRDRALVLGTAEYTWDLGNYLAAYLFVDAGRVLPSLADLSPGGRLRVGYGGGVQVHSGESFLGRLQLAASRDGDLNVELVLTPVFGRHERPGRL